MSDDSKCQTGDVTMASTFKNKSFIYYRPEMLSLCPLNQGDHTACNKPLVSLWVSVRNTPLIVFIKNHLNPLFSTVDLSLDYFRYDDCELGALGFKLIRRLNETLTRYYKWRPALNFTAAGNRQSALWLGAKSVRWDSKPRRGCTAK